MKLLFLTVDNLNTLQESGLYQDLLREFVKNGDEVYVVSPNERRFGGETHILDEPYCRILKVKTLNQQKCNYIEKGLGILFLEWQYIQAIKKFFSNVKFNLVLYSTPPITFAKVVQFVKKRDNARTYLLLKDIFPQNAVDLGMLKTTGLKGFLYRFFRKKEKKLYAVSDKIGCMSPANVQYVLSHNPEVDNDIIEVCSNSIDVIDKSVDTSIKMKIRVKYGIPVDKMIFVYGGNLGKPQGIPFMIECLRICDNIDNAFFLIVGDGTEYTLINEYVKKEKSKNIKLMKRLPKEDYDILVGACDVGLIFLDHRFTIPNFPSRLLSYMQAKLPVLAVTDPNTDIGKVITEGGFGWWCESNDPNSFKKVISNCIKNKELNLIGEKSYLILKNNYTVEREYKTIIRIMARGAKDE